MSAIASQNTTDYPNHNTVFMVWNFKKSGDVKKVFQRICALVGNLNNSAATRFPDARVSCVMGIGYEIWKTLGLRQPLPKELSNFAPIEGAKYTAVATPGDLHFHLRGDHFSICFDMATAIKNVLEPIADCAVEEHGFRYWDGRSILGFVDGTENPQGVERDFFGKIGKEDEAYEGGSYLFVQKYVHNMDAWRNLSVTEQEKVFGRSKDHDIEMSDDDKPQNAHSAIANIGDDKKIVRDNMPFVNNTTKEVGTYFIAYASTFSTVQQMLEAMFVGKPKGNYDRLLDFSTALTGTLFFVPTLDMLDDFAG